MVDSEKISVIIPAYNVEDYIESCINSILNQTYSNLEIIIINDGSTDNTGTIIDIIKKNDQRIHVIHKKNEGVFKARLIGFALSTGQYISFIDGDDEASPDMLKTLLENLKKHNADISHCGYLLCHQDKTKTEIYGTKKQVLQDNQKGLFDLLKGDYIEPGLWNKLYKRKTIQDSLAELEKYTEIKINEDLLMNYYFFRNSTISIYDDRCLYCYKLRNNSASRVRISADKMIDPLKVLKILYTETSENKELNDIIKNRGIRTLIFDSTIHLSRREKELKNFRSYSLKYIRRILISILKSDSYSKQLKILSVWVAFSPFTYKLVHTLHNIIKYN